MRASKENKFVKKKVSMQLYHFREIQAVTECCKGRKKKRFSYSQLKTDLTFLLNLHSKIFCSFQLIMHYLMTKFDRSQVEKILLGLVQLNPCLWKARSHFTHHPRQLTFYTSPISYASSVIWTHVYPEVTRGNDSEKQTHIFSARDLVFMVSVIPGIGNL